MITWRKKRKRIGKTFFHRGKIFDSHLIIAGNAAMKNGGGLSMSDISANSVANEMTQFGFNRQIGFKRDQPHLDGGFGSAGNAKWNMGKFGRCPIFKFGDIRSHDIYSFGLIQQE
jgi:hypothetical protein